MTKITKINCCSHSTNFTHYNMMKNKTKTTDVIGNGELMREAWKVRKAAAAEYGVDSRFVHFGSCVKVAAGVAKARVTDVWGASLGSGASKVNEYLLSGDCPVVIDYDAVCENTSCTSRFLYTHLYNLRKLGKVRESSGYQVVNAEARPFPHPEPSYA